jgi:hypothetical protein
LVPIDFHPFGLLRNHLGGKNFTDGKEVEMEVWKWLRRQSKDFYVVGFEALVKQWDKCLNVGGGHVKNYMFFPGMNIIYFTFVIYLPTLPHIQVNI